MMQTRKEYMQTNAEAETGEKRFQAHRDYYGQFVTDSIAASVSRQIGRIRLASSECRHFNDIPMRAWNNVSLPYDVLRKHGQANGSGGVSQLDHVCIAKEAARQWLESEARGDSKRGGGQR